MLSFPNAQVQGAAATHRKLPHDAVAGRLTPCLQDIVPGLVIHSVVMQLGPQLVQDVLHPTARVTASQDSMGGNARCNTRLCLQHALNSSSDPEMTAGP